MKLFGPDSSEEEEQELAKARSYVDGSYKKAAAKEPEDSSDDSDESAPKPTPPPPPPPKKRKASTASKAAPKRAASNTAPKQQKEAATKRQKKAAPAAAPAPIVAAAATAAPAVLDVTEDPEAMADDSAAEKAKSAKRARPTTLDAFFDCYTEDDMEKWFIVKEEEELINGEMMVLPTVIGVYGVDDNGKKVPYLWEKKELIQDHIRSIATKAFKPGRQEAPNLKALIAIITKKYRDVLHLRAALQRKRADDHMRVVIASKLYNRITTLMFGHFHDDLTNVNNHIDFKGHEVVGAAKDLDQVYKEMADIINQTNPVECRVLLPCSKPKHVMADVYNDRIENVANEEDVAGPPPPKEVTGKDVDTAVKLLMEITAALEVKKGGTGNHSNDAMVDVPEAIKKCKVTTKVTDFGAYYFYMQHEFHDGFLECLKKTIPEHLMGSKVTKPTKAAKKPRQAVTPAAADDTSGVVAAVNNLVGQFAKSEALERLQTNYQVLQQSLTDAEGSLHKLYEYLDIGGHRAEYAQTQIPKKKASIAALEQQVAAAKRAWEEAIGLSGVAITPAAPVQRASPDTGGTGGNDSANGIDGGSDTSP